MFLFKKSHAIFRISFLSCIFQFYGTNIVSYLTPFQLHFTKKTVLEKNEKKEKTAIFYFTFATVV